MPIPRREEINIHNSLDEQAACLHFHGKSLPEAELMFSGNAIFYQEDFIHMGAVAFRYYCPVMLAYLQSAQAIGDSDTVNCIASVLEFRFQHDSQETLLPIARQLAVLCRYVLDNYDKFTIDERIHRDLQLRYKALEQAFLNRASL